MIIKDFSLEVEQGKVHGVLFIPEKSNILVPVLLAQHGGSSHKKGLEILEWAELFVDGKGIALVAIDGPVHGCRQLSGSPESIRENFFTLWKSHENGIESMIQAWKAVIDLLPIYERLNTEAIGWLGLSMGTAYGIPLLASEKRIKAAVIGMWGLSFANSNRLAVDAEKITCPVLFQQKDQDELFDKEGQLALFAKIGATRKFHEMYSGGHVHVQGKQLQDLVTFLSENLLRF